MIARLLLASGTMLGVCALAHGQPIGASSSPTELAVAQRDVIYFHQSYPVFLRLHLQVDNASFDAPWRKYIESVFHQIDANQDGRLTSDETQGEADKHSAEIVSILRRRDLWTADDSPFDRAITLPELIQFLIDRKRGPFQPPASQPRPPNENNVGDSLFGLLDRDENRQLSPEELSHGAQSMRRRDLDDDGTFSASELTMRARTLFAGQAPETDQTTATLFVALIPGTSPAGVLRELVKRYGKSTRLASPGSDLNAEDLGLDATVFNEFDLDSSGRLDHDELRRLVKNPPPTLELLIRLGAIDKSSRLVEVLRSPSKYVSVRRTDQLVSIVLDNVQIEIAQQTYGFDGVHRYLARQFNSADQDNNQYLEEKEIQDNQAFLEKASFSQFDANGDGKIFQEEMTAVIDAKAEVARTRTRMSIQNRGRDLFQILDRDRNGRLSRHEFVDAARRIALWDTNADGAVGSNEVPQMFQLSLGPGVPDFRGVQLPGLVTQDRETNGSPLGPVWFQRMDRNKDGELARREFPGTRDQFRRLDTDKNGFVDPSEAAEAHERAKK